MVTKLSQAPEKRLSSKIAKYGKIPISVELVHQTTFCRRLIFCHSLTSEERRPLPGWLNATFLLLKEGLWLLTNQVSQISKMSN